MRRHAANIFNNRRRGEWNPLLLVMFALLAVAPSVLAAAPIRNAATQPQAVWQWLQSPEGAPTRDLLQQALSECAGGLWAGQNDECGILNAHCEFLQSQFLQAHSDIDSPLAPLNSSFSIALELNAAKPIKPFSHCAPGTRYSAFASVLSSHEAAKLSGIRTNRFRN